MNVTATMRIPSINGTDSLFVATQVQPTSCQFYKSSGIFFWLNKTSSTYKLNIDMRRRTVLLVIIVKS